MPYSLQPEIQSSLAKLILFRDIKPYQKSFLIGKIHLKTMKNEKLIAVFESLGYKARYNKKKIFYCRRSKNKDVTPLDSTSA